MELLKYHFLLFQCIGVWRPIHWSPGWKCNLYHFYTVFVIVMLVTVCLSEFIQLVMTLDDMEAFASNAFILFSMIAVVGKSLNILSKRNGILQLVQDLRENQCRPNTNEEHNIQVQADILARSTYFGFASVAVVTVFVLTLYSIVADVPRRAFPFESWVPFDCNEHLLGYSMVYAQQVFVFIFCGSVNAAFDTLLPGFVIHTCGQMQILKHRFHQLPLMVNKIQEITGNRSSLIILNMESKVLAQCVKHHLEILKISKTSNELFSFMIFAQYTISAVVLCVTVLTLTNMNVAFSLDCISQLVYLMGMLVQIFMYCFHGCQISDASVELGVSVYEMDWTVLSVYTRRSLVTIIARTLRPIKLTSFYIITLDLESFKSLLKISYSVFNMLHQT